MTCKSLCDNYLTIFRVGVFLTLKMAILFSINALRAALSHAHYTLPRNWKPFTCMASDAIVKSSPLVFLIIWVAYIFEIPQLLIMAIGVV